LWWRRTSNEGQAGVEESQLPCVLALAKHVVDITVNEIVNDLGAARRVRTANAGRDAQLFATS
jgi:hypothetical protein